MSRTICLSIKVTAPILLTSVQEKFTEFFFASLSPSNNVDDDADDACWNVKWACENGGPVFTRCGVGGWEVRKSWNEENLEINEGKKTLAAAMLQWIRLPRLSWCLGFESGDSYLVWLVSSLQRSLPMIWKQFVNLVILLYENQLVDVHCLESPTVPIFQPKDHFTFSTSMPWFLHFLFCSIITLTICHSVVKITRRKH